MILSQDNSKQRVSVFRRLSIKDPRQLHHSYHGKTLRQSRLDLPLNSISRYGLDYFILEVKQLLEVERRARGYYPPLPEVFAIIEREFGEVFARQARMMETFHQRFTVALRYMGLCYSEKGAAEYRDHQATGQPLLDMNEAYPLPFGTVDRYLMYKLPRLMPGDSFGVDGLTIQCESPNGFSIIGKGLNHRVWGHSAEQGIARLLMVLRGDARYARSVPHNELRSDPYTVLPYEPRHEPRREPRITAGRKPRHEPHRDTPEIRFWQKVERKNDSECWRWTGTQWGCKFKINTVRISAINFSWELHNHQPVPESMEVRQTCGNGLCVNPRHLCLETRSVPVIEGVSTLARVGDNNGSAKLDELKVIQIRDLYAAGRHTMRALSEMYGLNEHHIAGIIQRKTWKHAGGAVHTVNPARQAAGKQTYERTKKRADLAAEGGQDVQ